MLLVIIAIVVVLAAVYAYAYKKTRWDIMSLPYEIDEFNELMDCAIVLDHGKRRRLDMLMTLDFGELAGNRCYVVQDPADKGKQRCYAFWREPLQQGYHYDLDDGLRKAVQGAIIEAAASL